MTLSWSMDKVGPICRNAEDCALILSVIHGSDGRDQTVYNAPFGLNLNEDVKSLRVGYIQEIIEDKHVIVVDDSLVRGTSSRAIINALRKGGARKISLVITYPPIKFPCFAGIDFPSQEELATYTDGKDYSDIQLIEKVRNDIGADFLGYNDPENLARAIGIPIDSMCFTCVTGDYSSLGIKPVFKTKLQTENSK